MKQKIKMWCYSACILCLSSVLTTGCKKDDNGITAAPQVTVSDLDGNVYHTITIGTQVWMVENLNVTHYRNGDPIPNVTDTTVWANLTTGAYCDYDNTPGNSATYGRFYNWYAINDGRTIAPIGWHVPTDADWTTLTSYFGADSIAGGKLKTAGTTLWQTPNAGATNESGFKGLPAGSRDINGLFSHTGLDAYWWSSTLYGSTGKAWYRNLNYNYAGVVRVSSNRANGYSVRCVKD